MAFIINRGRYARETYPEPRFGGAAVSGGTGPTGPTGGTSSGGGGSPTVNNKQMAASATTLNGDLACVTAVAQTPVTNSNPSSGFIGVFVNGLRFSPGNGTKVSVPCYFSGDGGTTARALKSVVAGDLLYWNGSTAGFQLQTTDLIDFDYLVA